MPAREAVSLLQDLGSLAPSVHDERLSALVRQVLAQKEDLPLTLLVEIARVLQVLGLHKEVGDLVRLALESASFLAPEVVLSFAKTLAVTARLSESEELRLHTAAVFRILGEHIQEAMFDTEPEGLAEALLAVATFRCSRHGKGPDPALSQPWHHQVFISAAQLLQGRADTLPAQALLKCLRAYELFLGSIDLCEQLDWRVAAHVPSTLAESLALQIAQLPAKGAVRALCALASLRRHGVPLEAGGHALCTAAISEISQRLCELGVRDISFALNALATFADERWALPEVLVPAVTLHGLYTEVQRHIPSLTLEDALRMSKACERLAYVARPGVLLELLAAEVLRDLRNLKPQELCDAVVSFTRLGFEGGGFLENLAHSFVGQLPHCLPRQVSTILHGFASKGLHESLIYTAATKEIVRSIVGYRPRDLILSLWSFAKSTHVDVKLLGVAQENLKLHVSKLTPTDVSMLVWSLGKSERGVDQGLLAGLAHSVATGCRHFQPISLIVTCLGFAQLGFAQQMVLVELYRSLYGKLPLLSDPQLAYGFFLFSTSGLRDDALLQRFLYECGQRLPRLRGQHLSNVVLACSRMAGRDALAAQGLLEGLKQHIFGQLKNLGSTMCGPAPILGILLAAPELLSFSKEESLNLVEVVAEHVPTMDATELSRCLVATARIELVHKPFLLPLMFCLHKAREQLAPSEVISCIWAVQVLGFCKPKLRRSLGFMLIEHVQKMRIPARSFLQVMPALGQFDFWRRLPNSLRRSIWRLASDDLREHVSEPPPPPERPAPDGDVAEKPWCLPRVVPGLFRRRGRQGRLVDRVHLIEYKGLQAKDEARRERQEERELQEQGERPPVTGRTAVDDFLQLVRRL